MSMICRCGETGRRTGLKILRDLNSRAGSIPAICTNDVSVRTNKTDRYKNQSENKIWLIFLLSKNNIKSSKRKDGAKMKIINQELEFEECLKQRLEFICEFSKVTPTFINGSIRKLEKTNLTYVEPHKVIIKNITFLVFNYSNDVYISNLTKKIKLSELEEYLKKI